MNQLDEMPGARPAGVHEAAVDRKLAQHRFDRRNGDVFAAEHEAGAFERASGPARGSGVDKVNALLLEPRVAANGIAPIGIAAVGNDIARLQQAFELREHAIDRRSCRNVKNDEARRRQQRGELLEVAGGPQTGFGQIARHRMGVGPGDIEAFAECIFGEIGAHFSEADDAEAAN